MFICQYCRKECKNSNSLRNHERLCKSNPNRSLTNYEKNGPILGFNNKGRTSNRKGLRKETDASIQKMIITRAIHYKEGKFEYHRSHTEKTKQKLSEIAKANGLGGHSYKNIIDYNGIKLDSSYELTVAQSLDNNNIRWIRPSRFNYKTPNGEIHTYTPDFYLIDFDVYLEPKNDYLIENINPWLGYKDIQKLQWVMEQNNILIILLDKNSLEWDVIFDKICKCRNSSTV